MLIGEVLVSSLCLTSTNMHKVPFEVLSMSTLKLFGGTDLECIRREIDERGDLFFIQKAFMSNRGLTSQG